MRPPSTTRSQLVSLLSPPPFLCSLYAPSSVCSPYPFTFPACFVCLLHLFVGWDLLCTCDYLRLHVYSCVPSVSSLLDLFRVHTHVERHVHSSTCERVATSGSSATAEALCCLLCAECKYSTGVERFFLRIAGEAQLRLLHEACTELCTVHDSNAGAAKAALHYLKGIQI